MKLTELQAKHLEAVEWLISEEFRYRGTGRSTLLAYAFIKQALRNPAMDIKVWDTIRHPYSHERMLQHIAIVLQKEDEFKKYASSFRLNLAHLTITFKPYK